MPKVCKYTQSFDKTPKPLLNKTTVSTCFYYDLQILIFIFVILLGLYKY